MSLNLLCKPRPRRIAATLILVATVIAPVPAYAQDANLEGVGFARGNVCTGADGLLFVTDDVDTCESGVAQQFVTGISVGNASLGSSTTFSGGTVSFSGVTTAFGGGSTTFNNPVSFTGASVSFQTAASFDSSITTSGITNDGAVLTDSLLATGVGTGNLLIGSQLTVTSGATVDMGGNVLTNVGAGVNPTDAVNLAQLTAATSGIDTDIDALESAAADNAADIVDLQTTAAAQAGDIAALESGVTALETTTATHTTQITDLQTSVAAQAADISEVQTGLATTNANVAENTADIATNTANIATNTAAIATNTANIATNAADIADLQTGLADTNAALGAVDVRVDALEAVTANLGERLDDLKDRTDAGTATAVALSGGMFLPGNSFNLTGNVGAYRGAIAGAIQFGAMVSRRAAVNAGVAKGFNRHGKTAVRAGFSFGW